MRGAAPVQGGNPLSGRALERQFGISRGEAAKVRSEVAAMANGSAEVSAAEDGGHS
jgi:hypothetical protein